jgi:hypothetical protein
VASCPDYEKAIIARNSMKMATRCEQGLPIGEDKHPLGDSEVVPEVPLAAELLAASLIETVGQFEDLV